MKCKKPSSSSCVGSFFYELIPSGTDIRIDKTTNKLIFHFCEGNGSHWINHKKLNKWSIYVYMCYFYGAHNQSMPWFMGNIIQGYSYVLYLLISLHLQINKHDERWLPKCFLLDRTASILWLVHDILRFW